MEGNFRRTDSAKIWNPTYYAVTDKEGCFSCPNENYWIHDMPRLEELKEIESDEDFFN